MAPRTLPKPITGMRVADDNGQMAPEFERFLRNWHSIIVADQKATVATVIASAPPSVVTSGGIVIYRPTASSGSGYSAPTAAYDGNPATPATATINGVQTQQRTWTGFSALQATASALSLKVISGITGIAALPTRSDVITTARSGGKFIALDATVDDGTTTPPVANGATAKVEYTFNGGATWTALYDDSVSASRTDVISVPLSVKLSDIQVRATAEGQVTGAQLTHNILEIWVEVTP